MGMEAEQPTPAPQPVAAVPQWITTTPEWRKMRAGCRLQLAAIAAACEAADADGNLLYAIGGAPLLQACQCARSTFFERLRRLESAGFVVTLSRGGNIGDRQFGNVYGVPGRPGVLDARAVARRLQRMERGGDGVLRPVVIAPGEQARLFDKSQLACDLGGETGRTPDRKPGAFN